MIWFAALLYDPGNVRYRYHPAPCRSRDCGAGHCPCRPGHLGNFFGGAIITIDKPFKIGDRIQFDKYFGDIVSIGPRSTRLKTLDNQILSIPNSKITSNVVVNFAQPDIKMKVRIPFSVAYGTDMSRVKQILLGIARRAETGTGWVLWIPPRLYIFLNLGNRA